jgi:hypothetical protein
MPQSRRAVSERPVKEFRKSRAGSLLGRARSDKAHKWGGFTGRLDEAPPRSSWVRAVADPHAVGRDSNAVSTMAGTNCGVLLSLVPPLRALGGAT